ncbi:type II CAAX prenyl endopeptidase Rce1 family protein [Paenibacillus sp. NPDC058174]|uniref:CPBP family glutamic-type intramembrane protease n=1 Tax=Paenibacillus sp. NPDC058174 TaxID=3346366 RepID=UPI0036DF039F
MNTTTGSFTPIPREGNNEKIRRARKGLLYFFAMLIPLSILSYVLVSKQTPMSILLLMWSPALASIFARIMMREGSADISLRFGGRQFLKRLPFILLLPVIIGLIAYGTAWAAGLVDFVAPDTFIKAPPAVIFAGLLLGQMVAGTAIGILTSFGEELGWRGYMLTRLIDARIPAPMLTSGIIWGLWHLPVLFMGLYYSGPNLALSALLFMISCTSMSYIIGRVRMTTGSLWAAVLLHACWNAVIQDVFDAFSQGKNALLWTGESGILVALTLFIAAVLMSLKKMKVRQLY